MQCLMRCSGPERMHYQTSATGLPKPESKSATSLLVPFNPQPSAITTCVTAGSMPISGGHRMWSR